MKIAVDVSPVLPGGKNGGLKQLLWELLKGFEKFASTDKFILLTSYKNDHIFKDFDKARMQRICILKDSPVNRNLLKRLSHRIINKKLKFFNNQNILKKNGVSVLFCPFTAPTFSEIGIPTVSIIADLQHLYYPFFFSKQELIHRKFFYDQLKKKVDYIIAISSYTRETIIEKLNIPPGRVFAIPISIQSWLKAHRPGTSQSILNKFNLKEKKYCIYPANLWPHKNHKMLLVAFNRFQKQYPRYDLSLVLTGESIEGDKILLDSIKQMGLEDKVRFTGYLPEKEFAELWQHSYFLIFPSLFEGFGIPLVEAMRYKKPILASNVTSIPEVAGSAAVYFDPKKPDEIAAALNRIMMDKSVYKSLVKKGEEKLKEYNFQEMVKSYIKILHQAGENKKGKNQVIVSGIFADGWAGEKIQITFSKWQGKRSFELKGFLPQWHPIPKMKIRVGRLFKSSHHDLSKDRGLHIKEPLPAENGKLRITAAKHFIPGGKDNRKLSFMVKEFSVYDEESGKKLYEFKQ